MKNIVAAVLLSAGVLALPACQPTHVNPESRPLQLSADQQKLVAASNAFTLELFKRTASGKTGANILLSPLSVAMDAGMLLNGAKGTTQAEILNALRFTNTTTASQVNDYYRQLLIQLWALDPAVSMRAANSVWLRTGFHVQGDYLRLLKDYYGSTANTVAFDNTGKDRMNKWVNDATNGKIPQLIDQLDNDAVMYLLNALYFKGTWKYPFDKSKTAQAPFYTTASGSPLVDFMQGTLKINFATHNGISTYELPYGDNRYSMVIVSAGEAALDANVMTALDTVHLRQWLSDQQEVANTLYLPKFKTSFKTSLNDVMQNMGMHQAFGSAADFTGIIGDTAHEELYVSSITHAATIEVDEAGTTAAAATSIGVAVTSLPPTFRLDHPFVYLIRERSTGLIIFIGVMSNPKA